MKLQNEFLSLEFDEQTGSLIRLDDVKLGISHLQAPSEGRLFKLSLPDDKRNFNRHCDNRYSRRPPRLEKEKEGMVITYGEMRTEEGDGLPIGVTVRISLPAGGEEALFQIAVENKTDELIQEVHFPYIGGWRGDIRLGKTWLRTLVGFPRVPWPLDLHSLRKAPDNGFGKYHRRLFVHPLIPCMDISGEQSGISYICRVQKPNIGGLYLEDANERKGDIRLVWSWVFRPFLSKGAKWKSDPVAISTHDGDWHVTADRTRNWLQTWWTSPAIPRGLKSSMGLFMIQYHEFCGGVVLNSPETILENAKYCREHGLDHIMIWDPVMEHYLRPFIGEMCEYDDACEQKKLTELVHDIRKLGMHVSAWMDFRLMNLSSETGRQCQDKWSMRGLYGVPLRESYSFRQHNGDIESKELDLDGRRICLKNPEYQKWALQRVRKYLEIGFDSFAFDQPFEEWFCFSPEHGHSVPVPGEEGAYELVGRVVKFIKDNNPEAIILGEHPQVQTSTLIPINFKWSWKQGLIDVYRHILPDALVMVPFDPYEGEDNVLPRAFVMGCQVAVNVKGSEKPLSDVPDLAARLKRLADLRKKTAAFTVEGQFLDTKGLTLDMKKKASAAADAVGENTRLSGDCIATPPMLAAVYAAGEKLGVIVGDCSESDSAGGGQIGLTIDLAILGKSNATVVKLHRESGEIIPLMPTMKNQRLALSVDLGKWECAVLEII